MTGTSADWKVFYRRTLPHWQPADCSVFVTFRLYDSLTAETLRRMTEELEFLARELDQRKLPSQQHMVELARGRFALQEAALDKALKTTSAARWLENPAIAGMVQSALHFRNHERYRLERYVVMPNHVHLLIYPLPQNPEANPQEAIPANPWPLAGIMKGIKGYTGHEANRIIGRTGPFWWDESFDHWIRDEAEWERIREYIDQNPVKAGLCKAPHGWPWSSAAEEVGEKQPD